MCVCVCVCVCACVCLCVRVSLRVPARARENASDIPAHARAHAHTHRKCPDATTQLCAPLRSAAISAAVLGARTASEAAALCESITRRAVRYDPEAVEMGTIGGVPAELKATCGW